MVYLCLYVVSYTNPMVYDCFFPINPFIHAASEHPLPSSAKRTPARRKALESCSEGRPNRKATIRAFFSLGSDGRFLFFHEKCMVI